MNNKQPDMWGEQGVGDGVPSQVSNYPTTVNPANLSPSTDKACMKGSSFIGEYLFELWKNQCLCDVRLQVEDKSFLAHKIVLAAFSDVFCPSQPQIKPTLCITVPGTTPDAIYQILLYLYTSEMHLTDCNLEPVLVAACYMGVTDIVDMIRAILDRPTVENLQHYMDIRRRQGMKHSILDFPKLIKEHFADLIEEPVFLCITFEELETLLMNPNLMVNTEMDTVRAVISWLEFNPLNRTQHTARLLELVNLEAVDTNELCRLKQEKQHLFDDTIASEIIMDAFIKRAKACSKNSQDPDLSGNNRSMPRAVYGDLSMNKTPTDQPAMLVETSAQEPYGIMHIKNENTITSSTARQHNIPSRVPRSQYMEQENGYLSRKKSPYTNRNMSKSPTKMLPVSDVFYEQTETLPPSQNPKFEQDNILHVRDNPPKIHQSQHSFIENKYPIKGSIRPKKTKSPSNTATHGSSLADPGFLQYANTSSKTSFIDKDRATTGPDKSPIPGSLTKIRRTTSSVAGRDDIRSTGGSQFRNNTNAAVPPAYLPPNDNRSYRKSPYEKEDSAGGGIRSAHSPPANSRGRTHLPQLERSPRHPRSTASSPERGSSMSPGSRSWRAKSPSPQPHDPAYFGRRKSREGSIDKNQ